MEKIKDKFRAHPWRIDLSPAPENRPIGGGTIKLLGQQAVNMRNLNLQ